MCFVTFDFEDTDARRKHLVFKRRGRVSWASVEVSERCDFRCRWCYVGKQEGTALGIDEALDMIAVLAEAGVEQVTLTGGEPLLWPHTDSFVAEARDRGMVVHMNTNGYYLTGKRAKTLAGLGLSQVQMNIDSLDREKHDRIRGKPGSFDMAVKAFGNAHKAGIDTVCMTVATKENVSELVEIIRYAHSLGVSRYRVTDAVPSGSALGMVNENVDDYIGLLSQLDSLFFDLGARAIESFEPLFQDSMVKTKLPIYGTGCVGLKGLFMAVNPSGDVYYCFSDRQPLLNIFDSEDIQADYRQALGRIWNPPAACDGCSQLSTDLGGCPARVKAKGFDYFCGRLK